MLIGGSCASKTIKKYVLIYFCLELNSKEKKNSTDINILNDTKE